MKKTLLALIALTAIMLNYSCMTEKRANRLRELLCHGNSTTQNDSTSITTTKTTPEDSTYYYVAQAYYRAYMECDSNGQVVIKSVDTIFQSDKAITGHIQMQGNNAFFDCRVDSGAVVARWNETHTVKETKVKNDKKEVTPPVYIERKLTKWQQVCLIGFPICLALFALWLVWKLWLKKKFSFTINPFG